MKELFWIDKVPVMKQGGEQNKYRSAVSKKIASLEKQIQGQQIVIKILVEFAKSVANTEQKDLISYQQFHSPSTASSQKVRMLLDKIREFG